MKLRSAYVLSTLFSTWLLTATVHGQEVPELTGRVVDLAEVLSPETEREITAVLTLYEEQRTHQIAVLTIPSLEGRAIESFAIEVARTWELGQGEEDNGVLLLIVPGDRKTRIEVGSGVEGLLTDLTCGVILREIMRPCLQNDDHDGALWAGVLGIMDALDGEELNVGRSESSESSDELSWTARILIVLTVLGVLFLVSYTALMFGGAATFVMFLAFGNPLAVLAGFVLGAPLELWIGYVAAYLLVFLYMKVLPRGRALRKRLSQGFVTSGTSGSSGYSVSYASSSSYDSDSGSSFSGGGGDFSGGGASDDY